MGANLSKQPRTEVAKMGIVIAALCFWLQKVVNEPHNPPREKRTSANGSCESASPPSAVGSTNPPRGLTKTPSVVNLTRSERLSRAKELERSVPRSYRMAAESFAKCFVAIGVLDVLFARHSKVSQLSATFVRTNCPRLHAMYKHARVWII